MSDQFTKEHQVFERNLKKAITEEKNIDKSMQELVYHYFDNHKRSFPWRKTKRPYNIFISEVMLQQTQAPRVIEKYTSWIKRFKNFEELASASFEDVLAEWKGLGYNRRAKFLHQSAKKIIELHNGKLPKEVEQLEKLPGIGPNTARSISAFAFNKPVVFIETNIRAVFLHIFFKNNNEVSDKKLMPLIEETLDRQNPRDWYNALMDYGTMLKKKYKNPSRKSKHHIKQKPFKNSNREIRGLILKILLEKKGADKNSIIKLIEKDPEKIILNLKQLEKEHFVTQKNGKYIIA